MSHTNKLPSIVFLFLSVFFVSGCGDEFSLSVASVKKNTSPVIFGEPGSSVEAGEEYRFEPLANDLDGDKLLYSISGKPAWAEFDTATGVLWGTPGRQHADIYPDIVITVTDGIDKGVLGPFSITVVASNQAPVIGGEPPLSVEAGGIYRFVPTSGDDDGDSLQFSIEGKPAWAEFNPATGELTGRPGAEDAGSYSGIVISVSDGTLGAALPAFQLTVLPPPVAYNLDKVLFPLGEPPRVGAEESYEDPLSGYRVLRITDVDNLNPPRSRKNPGRALEGGLNEYSIPDIENADGSMLIVMATNSNFWYLYDVQSGAYIKEMTDLGVAAEPRWDVSDPNVLYYRKGTALYRYDVAGERSEQLYDFRQDYPDMQIITSGTKGEASADGRYRPFIVRAGGPAADLDWIVFDFETNRIVGSYVAATGSRPAFKAKYCVLSPSGDYVLVNATQAPGGYRPYVYRRDFSGERRMGTRKGHFDFALDASGREVFVAQDSDTDWITATYLEDLSELNLLKLNFSSSTYVGLHLSGNNYDRPGWVLVSTYGPQTSRGEEPAIWSDGTHYMLEIKQNGRHWRVAQTFTRFPQTNRKYYWLEAAATINRRGTHIYWGANHNDQRERYVDLYQLTLPESWYRDLQGE